MNLLLTPGLKNSFKRRRSENVHTNKHLKIHEEVSRAKISSVISSDL